MALSCPFVTINSGVLKASTKLARPGVKDSTLVCDGTEHADSTDDPQNTASHRDHRIKTSRCAYITPKSHAVGTDARRPEAYDKRRSSQPALEKGRHHAHADCSPGRSEPCRT